MTTSLRMARQRLNWSASGWAVARALAALLLVLASGDARPEARALLVGVSDYPTLPAGVQRTPGARNDVALLRDTLQQRGFTSGHIRVFADGVPNAEQPTRANILRALDEMATTSQPGDFVFLHFSGHGSMEPGARPGEEALPIFLPIDIGRWNGGVGRVDNAITRQDLRDRVDRIADKGAFVWGVFDTCHAASLVRQADPGSLPRRFVQPSWLGTPSEASQSTNPRSASGLGLLGGRPKPASGRGGTVFFYAAQPGESTVELPLPRGAAHARRHGLFSFHVSTALQGRRTMTYRQLAQAILTAYQTTPEAYSTPIFSGDSLDQVVLGQEVVPLRQWPLRVDAGLYVDAGTLMGMVPGSLLAVVGSPTATEQEVIGHLRVIAADLGRARLEPTLHTGSQAIDVKTMRSGHYLRLVHSPPEFRLRAAHDPRGCTGGCNLNAAIARLRESGAQGVDLQWVESGELADVLIRSRRGRVELLTSAHQYGSTAGHMNPAGLNVSSTESPVELAAKLGRGLHAVARSRNLLTLAWRMAGEPPATGMKVVLHHRRRSGKHGEVVDPGTVPRLSGDDTIIVTVENGGQQALDVTVLRLDAQHGIEVLFPGTNGESNRLPSGTSRQFEDVVARVAQSSQAQLLVIGRLAMPGSERSDFSFLSQPSLTRTRATSERELEAFADAAFAEYRRRGLAFPRATRGAIDMQVFTLDVRSGRNSP